jgi:hypothetical protein
MKMTGRPVAAGVEERGADCEPHPSVSSARAREEKRAEKKKGLVIADEALIPLIK